MVTLFYRRDFLFSIYTKYFTLSALDKQTINEIYLFLLAYIKNHPKKIILNITHNLSDLKNLKGNYYLIEDFKMIRFTNQTEVIQKYIEG